MAVNNTPWLRSSLRGTSHGKIFIFLLLCLTVQIFYALLPSPLFRDPTSTVLLDKRGDLLGARISADQQWRFPEVETVPEKFKKALVTYEDRFFYFHPGINPVSVARALYLNLKQGHIVSGGSTITMQTIRLSRKNRERTILQKLAETFLAFRMEFTYSKDEILRIYASHAPFGGNVVGLEAASWRYFGIDPDNLSWAEAATLAVLPNSPGLIYPGRNQRNLLAKRNALLDKMFDQGIIDAATCVLAKSELLPARPYPIPKLAPHLLDRAIREGHRGERVMTTLDRNLQAGVNRTLEFYSGKLKANYIFNAAALVIEVNTGNVTAYCGNLPENAPTEHGVQVDVIRSPRSTGSILKPFLYAAMLHDGLLLPNTLVPDIPTQISGFIPENYNLTYDGAVPARMALSRSLNIPAVKMLQTYGYEQFWALLRKLGMSTLVKAADHYGLALILGGAEATLWDLAGIYASMARTLNVANGPVDSVQPGFRAPEYIATKNLRKQNRNAGNVPLDPGSIWLTFEAMMEVARPDDDLQWQHFASSRKIAWKTGTSFGNRDAWSIGLTPSHVVAVWAGNATGEGRPGLTGISAAAPLLFDIFKFLPQTGWFSRPDSALMHIPVCRYSGHRPGPVCDAIDTVWIPKTGARTAPCPYHHLVHLDKTGTWQVNSSCEAPENMLHVSWFILPPVQEWYFRSKNPFYKTVPPFRSDCALAEVRKNMEIIYPRNNSKVYIPVDLDGTPGSAVFKLAHRDARQKVFWHLDERFIGISVNNHQMALKPERGIHLLTLVDQNGETLKIRFEVISDKDRK